MPSSSTNTVQKAYRLPPDLVKRLDKQVEKARAAQPGLNVTRSDLVRILLTRGITAMERSKDKPLAMI